MGIWFVEREKDFKDVENKELLQTLKLWSLNFMELSLRKYKEIIIVKKKYCIALEFDKILCDNKCKKWIGIISYVINHTS